MVILQARFVAYHLTIELVYQPGDDGVALPGLEIVYLERVLAIVGDREDNVAALRGCGLPLPARLRAQVAALFGAAATK